MKAIEKIEEKFQLQCAVGFSYLFFFFFFVEPSVCGIVPHLQYLFIEMERNAKNEMMGRDRVRVWSENQMIKIAHG